MIAQKKPEVRRLLAHSSRAYRRDEDMSQTCSRNFFDWKKPEHLSCPDVLLVPPSLILWVFLGIHLSFPHRVWLLHERGMRPGWFLRLWLCFVALSGVSPHRFDHICSSAPLQHLVVMVCFKFTSLRDARLFQSSVCSSKCTFHRTHMSNGTTQNRNHMFQMVLST